MKSPNTLTLAKLSSRPVRRSFSEGEKRGSASGFTLIEILITIGIIVIVSTLGLLVSMDFFRGYSFGSERSIVVSTIQKARIKAMSNINEVSHGVHYGDCDLYSECYILFEGDTFDAGDANNQEIQASGTVNVSWPNDVVFTQLSGECETCPVVPDELEIELTQDDKAASVFINYEGRIDWE